VNIRFGKKEAFKILKFLSSPNLQKIPYKIAASLAKKTQFTKKYYLEIGQTNEKGDFRLTSIFNLGNAPIPYLKGMGTFWEHGAKIAVGKENLNR
jgi:hypothetical protein